MTKRIAIIPARGGSKRILNKNILSFHGKPMIAYALEAASKSNLFDLLPIRYRRNCRCEQSEQTIGKFKIV